MQVGRFFRTAFKAIGFAIVLGGGVSLFADPMRVEERSDFEALVDESGFYGCIAIYDISQNVCYAGYGEQLDDPRIPASTFKVCSSLVALQTGVIEGPESVILWDGVIRSRPEINKDLTFRNALQVSAVPHYQQLVRKIGPQRMQHWIDTADYGNRDLSGGDDQFWLVGGLRITPREQLRFLEKLIREELAFDKQHQRTVKSMMLVEDGEGYRLFGKTGWATLEGESHFGWWVGWVETEKGTFVFVSSLQATGDAKGFGPARLQIAREALATLGLIPST